MSKHVLLNNVDHKDLKVIVARAAKYGDDVMFAMTFPEEFRSVQAHYPIFFHKDPKTGKFYAAAIFGFEAGENLFLDDQGWQASYIPLSIKRQPFLIGIQQFQEDGEQRMQRVIHVDMNSPRLSKTEGEPLFMEHGGNTSYLEHMAAVLETIHHGHEQSQAFVEMLLKLELLESFVLNVELNNGAKHQLRDFYTINEDKLAGLNGENLAELNRQGWLIPIYMVLASQSNIRLLIDKKNQGLSI